MTDLLRLAEAVAQATPARPADAPALAEAVAVFRDERLLSVSEVAGLLGVSSPATIHNWLARGAFPGATRTAGGHRRFRMSDVLAVAARIRQTEADNRSGNLEPPDYGAEDPYAGRARLTRRAGVDADRGADHGSDPNEPEPGSAP